MGTEHFAGRDGFQTAEAGPERPGADKTALPKKAGSELSREGKTALPQVAAPGPSSVAGPSVVSESGTHAGRGSLKLGEWMEWWVSQRQNRLEKSTIAKYRQCIHRYILPGREELLLKDFSDMHVLELYGAMEERGLSAQTVHLVKTILQSSLHMADRLRVVPYNVCEGHYIQKRVFPQAEVLPEELIRGILLRKRPSSCENLFPVLLTGMLRFGEGAGLSWDDVDEQKHLLHIRRQLLTYYQDGHICRSLSDSLKNHRNRVVRLPGFAFAYLEDERRQQELNRLRAKSRWRNPYNLVFTDECGGFLHHDKVTRRWKKMAAEYGVPEIPLHALRHTGATVYFAATGDITGLRQMTGHSSDGAATYYIHSLERIKTNGGRF